MVKKNLIIATGSAQIILDRWLPLLRGVGEYQGDVLIIDYGVLMYGKPIVIDNAKAVEKLREKENVTVLQPKMQLKNIFVDRYRVAKEYLRDKDRYTDYGTVMLIDGNDTIFWGSILPLLKKAQKKLCCVQEHKSNLLKIWNDFNLRDFIMEGEYKVIQENPIINGGMVIGPVANILELMDYEQDMMDIYGSECSDQVFLDILIYYYKYPHILLNQVWNYTHAVIGKEDGYKVPPRRPIYRDGKAYSIEDNKEVVIEHRTGTGWRMWTSRYGLEMLNGDRPITVMAEYDWEDKYAKGLFKKGIIKDVKAGKETLFNPTYLFPREIKKANPTFLFPIASCDATE
jgi:hypothetical protein